MEHLTHKDLTPGQNNVWYEYNNSEDVVVFVHGFFSESAGAWLYENKLDHTKDQFWPDLIRSDARLANPSLFLGGFHSTLDSGNYGFDNCADECQSGRRENAAHAQSGIRPVPAISVHTHTCSPPPSRRPRSSPARPSGAVPVSGGSGSSAPS